MSDEQDYKDYLDYQDYVKSQATPQSAKQPGFSAAHPYLSGTAQMMAPPLAAKGISDDLNNSPDSGMANVGRLLRTQVEHGVNTAGLGYLPQAEGGVRSLISGKPYVQERDAVIQRMSDDARDYPNAAAMGKTGGAALGMAAAPAIKAPAALSGAVGGLAKILAGGATGAAYGAAANPGDTPGVVDPVQAPARTGDAVLGGLFGAGSAALPMVADGARGMANGMMKRAVGLTGASAKSFPQDIGNRIADEGIWGTKAGMSEQVAQKYADAESRIQDLANQTQGRVGANGLAHDVGAVGNEYINPETGRPIPGGEEGFDVHNRVAQGIREGAKGYAPESEVAPEQEGDYGAKSLLQMKRMGDAEAFNQSGMMGNTHKAQAYRAQADASRSALSNITGGQMPEALTQEQTLLAAHRGLNKPEVTYRNPMSLTDIGASMNMSGLPGKAGSVLASKAVVSPLAQSMGAQGLQKIAAPALDTAGQAGQTLNPYLIQLLYGDAK